MRPAFVVLLVVFCSFIGMSLQNASGQGTNDLVARGQYLVMSAGKCADCHGPNLRGALLDFLKPGLPVQYRSPKISGLTMLSAANAMKFFETGELPNGKHARPPMPQYRFNHDDASAIVAYLKSLK